MKIECDLVDKNGKLGKFEAGLTITKGHEDVISLVQQPIEEQFLFEGFSELRSRNHDIVGKSEEPTSQVVATGEESEGLVV